MNALRSVREARINFLFFQDIITCVMGILILATLILSLSLDTGEAATPEETQLQSQLTESRRRFAELEHANRTNEEQRLVLASLPEGGMLETELGVLRQQASNMTAQLRQRRETAVAAKIQTERAMADQESAAQARKKIDALQKEISNAREELAEARRRTNSIYIVPAADAQNAAREPVAFVVGANKIEVKRVNSSLSETHDLNTTDDLRALFSELDSAREYVVFYFRPSGTKWFEPFRNLARSLGFAVGYDAIEEQKEVIFFAK